MMTTSNAPRLRRVTCGHAAAALVLLAVLLGGCSEKRATPTGPSTHPGVWTQAESEDFHGAKVAVQGATVCFGCHTATALHPDEEIEVALSCANSAACHASDAGPSALKCEGCHTALGGAHTAHFGSTPGDCSVCHASTAADSASLLLDGEHLDSEEDVTFAAGFGGEYDDDAGTCNATYCHGAGVTTTSWTTGTPLGCNDCHSTASLPGAHAAHASITGGDCVACHGGTVSSPTTLANRFAHANGVADVALGAQWGGTYSSSTHSCSGTYCHGAANTTPAWASTTPLGCGDCHTPASLPGGHAKHLPMVRGACDGCHDETVTSAGELKPGGPHVDGDADVAMRFGMTYDSVASTCSQGCHFVDSASWFSAESP